MQRPDRKGPQQSRHSGTSILTSDCIPYGYIDPLTSVVFCSTLRSRLACCPKVLCCFARSLNHSHSTTQLPTTMRLLDDLVFFHSSFDTERPPYRMTQNTYTLGIGRIAWIATTLLRYIVVPILWTLTEAGISLSRPFRTTLDDLYQVAVRYCHSILRIIVLWYGTVS